MTKFKKIDLSGVKTYSVKNRKSKVSLGDFAKPTNKDQSIEKFINNLPSILNGQSFKEFLEDYIRSVKSRSSVLLMMGAHVIKVGLSPLIINAMKKGWITHLAVNGS